MYTHKHTHTHTNTHTGNTYTSTCRKAVSCKGVHGPPRDGGNPTALAAWMTWTNQHAAGPCSYTASTRSTFAKSSGKTAPRRTAYTGHNREAAGQGRTRRWRRGCLAARLAAARSCYPFAGSCGVASYSCHLAHRHHSPHLPVQDWHCLTSNTR